GGDTGATLGGAALGGVIGSQINKNDQRYYR
ncbi:glycine zipper 2TM domain-containing protein, partial [Pasteurellaceae bacterium USgator11]